jgi:hypothetical protein
MELDELKNAWKNKTTEKLSNVKEDFSGTLEKVYVMEKKTKVKYTIATFAMGFELVIFLLIIMFYRNIFTKLTLAGIMLVIISVIIGGFSIWSTNILFKEKDILNPGTDFLKKINDKLERRKFLRVYLVPVILVMIAFGVTIVLSENISSLSVEWKIFIYTITYLYIIIIYFVTARKEIRKEKNEIEPIRKTISKLIYQAESEL